MSDDNTLDIYPVLRPDGERCADDQVLGRAGAKRDVRRIRERGGPRHRQILEGQGTEGDVKANAGGRAQEQCTVRPSEARRVH